MWKHIFGRPAEVPIETPYDSTRDLQPIFYCFQFYGIDLQSSSSRSACRRYVTIFLSVTSVVVMLSTAIKSTLNLFAKSTPNYTNDWLNILDDCSWTFWNSSFPVAVFYAARFKWNTIWNRMKSLEKLMNYGIPFHRRLRKASITLTAFAFVMVKTFNFSYDVLLVSIDIVVAGDWHGIVTRPIWNDFSITHELGSFAAIRIYHSEFFGMVHGDPVWLANLVSFYKHASYH